MYFLFVLFLCVSCSDDNPRALRVGVTYGPHTEIANYVAQMAKKEGLDVEVISFDDFQTPNETLNAGNIHINIYQHRPFLQHQIQTYGYAFDVKGSAIFMPLGLYGSASIHALSDIPRDAKVLIPVDPTNNARALLLLQDAGFLTLSTQIHPTRKDIQDNPKHLRIIQVEAPLIPRLLHDDGDIAVINSDWVMVADMDPKEALFTEKANTSEFNNVMVIRKGEPPHIMEKIDHFVKLYQSKATASFIQSRFNGAIVSAWENP